MIASIPGVCQARWFGRESAQPDLLIEVPHGATRTAHYQALHAQLRGALPEDLIAFFHVNTDAGAPEYACALAEQFVHGAPQRSALVLLCEIPRTFIDCNRVLDISPEEYKAGKVTPGLPPYIRDERDQRLLRSLHEQWVRVTDEAWNACGAGVMAHTYAPRSVDVEVDDQIIASLRRAYEDVERWPLRPQIDIIARDPAGAILCEPLVRRVEAEFTAAGFETAISGTYPMHPSTLAYGRAARFRAVCVEVRRDLLARQFTPFVEVQIDSQKAARIAAPLARAVSP